MANIGPLGIDFPQRKTLEIILAATPKGEIGAAGQIPWHLKGDLPRFKEMTMGQTLIMGARTYASLRGPLKGRTVIVLSSTLHRQVAEKAELEVGYAHPLTLAVPTGVEDTGTAYVTDSIERALALARTTSGTRIFIAGGVQLYQDFLAMGQSVDFLHLTLVYKDKEVPEPYDAVIPNFFLTDYFDPYLYPETVYWINPKNGVEEVSHVYTTYRGRQSTFVLTGENVRTRGAP